MNISYSETDFTQEKKMDDHLQEADPFGLSFARGQSLRMIMCNNEKGMKNAL